ncbi:HTTM domain-containing protein [Natronolimnohabitans sp. A-GB9]|uniref:HTTM domain-containing protein n=1 Tax=Natronolimnohabitans sp. A-GB9 TaxID=3069757 RepID=UPI0027AE2BDE|nr:HTTM domain-containing protein [Natronolimnohabitans sp. A-GB9]MDQ2050333.1 HTTM domain-containing protein [Natronolimnohabitans sp. A-GB9]
MGPATVPSLSESSRRLRARLRRGVRIDTRTLAVFRVFAGLLVVADLFLRSRNFGFFYTSDGVVPQSLVLETVSPAPFSVYHLTTDPTLIAALLGLQGLIAIQLIVGYKTRLATVLTFLFVVSLDHHNPFVLSYADTLFRLLLFWAIFLPLGERWSIDAVHADREPRASVAGVASALILTQMVFMYFTNGLIKSQSDVWTGGDAAPLVMGIDEMTFLLGDTIGQFPTLLEYGGLLWFWMLLSSPLLILLRGRPRMLLVGLFVGGHLSFAVTVRIGAFPYVALAGVLLFLQARFWDDLAAVGRRLGIDPSRLAARASRLETLAGRVPDVRVTDDRFATARERVYTLALGVVVVTILFVTVVVAFNVGVAAVDGESDEPLEQRVDGAIDETLSETTGVAHVETTASRLGIDQPIGWGVFAGPDPRTTDRYYVFPAETESGDLVDAYNERPLTFDRPHDELQKQHDTYRERFYMNSVRRGGYSNDIPDMMAEHVCERWPEEHDEELVSLEMYVVEEEITHDTVDDPEHRDREFDRFYRHGCGDNEPGSFPSPE